MRDAYIAQYDMLNAGTGRVVLKYLLEMKLDTFWAIGEAEGGKIVRISLFDHKGDPYAYLETKRDGVAQSCSLLEYLRKDLLRYVQGGKISFLDYPLEMDNYSSFSTRIWTLAQEIPYGEVRSYKWLSEKARTRAYRAVGRALARNPFPLLVPCHRVIRKNGGLGGYSAGLELKKKFLRIEGTFVS